MPRRIRVGFMVGLSEVVAGSDEEELDAMVRKRSS